MALVIDSLKRLSNFEELLHLDPHVAKRCRLEALIEAAADNSNASPEEVEVLAAAAVGAYDTPRNSAVSAPTTAISIRGLRRQHDDMDDDVADDVNGRSLPSSSPAEKRLRRLMMEAADTTGATAGSTNDAAAAQGGCAELDVRAWSEKVVRSLHGCPSVEAALQRSSAVLGDLASEVRQATTREFDAAKQEAEARAAAEEGNRSSEQQSMNRVLRRAVQHLAKRCSKLQADGAENESLRQALELAQDAQRRLKQSNEVLQAHLRLHLDGVQG